MMLRIWTWYNKRVLIEVDLDNWARGGCPEAVSRLTGFGYESIKADVGSYSIWDTISNAGGDHATVAMSHEGHICQLFILNGADYLVVTA